MAADAMFPTQAGPPADRPGEELVRRLLAAVSAGVTDQRIDELVAAARAEAEAEIQAMVKSALKAALLRRAVGRLEAAGIEAPSLEPLADVETEAEGEPIPSAGPSESSESSELLEPLVLRPAARPADDAAGAFPPVAPSPASDPALACYVYCITRAGPLPAADDEAAVGASFALEAVRHEDVQAVVARVPIEEFARVARDGRATDPQWLEARVLAHDRVVKSALSAGAVIPCRFCTVVRGVGDVRRLLVMHYDRITATLSALEGKQEWGVKIYARHRPAREPAASARKSAAGSGKAYLAEKRQAAHDRGNAERAERALAEACHQDLAAAASEAALLPVRGKAAEKEEKLLLNGTYLVADVSAFDAALSEAADRYRPRGLALEVTGPWPPYNFVRLDLSAELSPQGAA